MHHGIKGQKWGVRRFRNDDGTLTEAGKARYGGQREYKDSRFREALTGGRTIAKVRYANGSKAYIAVSRNAVMSSRYKNKADKYAFKSEQAAYKGDLKKSTKMANKSLHMKNRSEAYRKLDLDRIAYDSHTSTGKLFAQNAAFGYWTLGEIYRDKRAMGVPRGKAFVSTIVTGGIGHGSDIEEHYQQGEKSE